MATYKYSLKKIDITPENPQKIGLGAYRKARNGMSEGVKDNIYLFLYRYMIADKEFSIISLDFLWIDEFFYQQIKKIVEENTQIKPHNILIYCTHTHSAPYVSKEFTYFGNKNENYNNFILKLIKDNINNYTYKEAKHIEEGYFDAPNLIANRNYIIKNNNNEIIIPSPSYQLAHENKIRFVKLTPSESGKPTYIINFSCHPTFNKSNYISSDYPGVVRKIFENKSCHAMFIQGYAGDQKADIRKYTGKSSIKALRYFKILPSFGENLDVFTRSINNILSLPKISIQKKQTEAINNGVQYEFKLSMETTVRLHKIPLTENVKLFAINAEPSYQLAEAIDEPDCWPVGYANGMLGYIPNLALIRIKTGYEYNSWSSFNLNTPMKESDVITIIDNMKKLALEL